MTIIFCPPLGTNGLTEKYRTMSFHIVPIEFRICCQVLQFQITEASFLTIRYSQLNRVFQFCFKGTLKRNVFIHWDFKSFGDLQVFVYYFLPRLLLASCHLDFPINCSISLKSDADGINEIQSPSMGISEEFKDTKITAEKTKISRLKQRSKI